MTSVNSQLSGEQVSLTTPVVARGPEKLSLTDPVIVSKIHQAEVIKIYTDHHCTKIT